MTNSLREDELRRARDAACDKIVNETGIVSDASQELHDRIRARQGWDACLEHLSKGVEFDEFAARDKWLTMYEEFECGGPVLAVLSLARWQFDQLSPYVKLGEVRGALISDLLKKIEELKAEKIGDLLTDLQADHSQLKSNLLKTASQLDQADNEIACLRSVLSEYGSDHSGFTQFIVANEIAKARGK